MQKKSLAIIGLGTLALCLAVALIYTLQTRAPVKSKEITLEAALEGTPYIRISEEEASLMESLWQNEDVKAALQNGDITSFSPEQDAALADGRLPADIQISEFSVINKAICFGYFTGGSRITLERFPDGSIRKTVGNYSEDGTVKTVYENDNNTTYSKSVP